MPSSVVEPPESLRVGRRALDGIPEFTLLDDWVWEPALATWMLHGCISLDIAGDEFVPATTDWYVKASPAYPWGTIAFYPSAMGGLVHTFPHQNYNGAEPTGRQWRSGRLCVDTPAGVLGRGSYDVQPYGEHYRLAWHVQRVIEWLKRASEGSLAAPCDPFELPDFRTSTRTILGFNETADRLAMWNSVRHDAGLADVSWIPGADRVCFVRSFRSLQGSPIDETPWGEFLAHRCTNGETAMWVRIGATPVLPPWQAPMIWGELRQTVGAQGIDLDSLFRRGTAKIRDGKEHLLLVGFPIPEVVDGPAAQVHWLAAELPALTVRSPDGFRPTNDQGRWHRDRTTILNDNEPIRWIRTENWSDEEFHVRGRFNATLADRKVAIIGAGALGSVISELLVRGGVRSVSICDADDLHVGNLARHTLDLESAGRNKAQALATKLNASSPHAEVTAIEEMLTVVPGTVAPWLDTADMVLDCTGSDEALSHLSRYAFNKRTEFVSISLGMFARRVYVFRAKGARFPHEEFNASMEPWLRRELSEHRDAEIPREGIGCWHILFPARVDEVWMMAAAAVRMLEEMMLSPASGATLAVMEQVFENGRFSGLRNANLA